jgi:hypothetical protein
MSRLWLCIFSSGGNTTGSEDSEEMQTSFGSEPNLLHFLESSFHDLEFWILEQRARSKHEICLGTSYDKARLCEGVQAATRQPNAWQRHKRDKTCRDECARTNQNLSSMNGFRLRQVWVFCPFDCTTSRGPDGVRHSLCDPLFRRFCSCG